MPGPGELPQRPASTRGARNLPSTAAGPCCPLPQLPLGVARCGCGGACARTRARNAHTHTALVRGPAQAGQAFRPPPPPLTLRLLPSGAARRWLPLHLKTGSCGFVSIFFTVTILRETTDALLMQGLLFRAKVVNKEIKPPRFRVAMIATKVPAEPLSMLQKTLTAMLNQVRGGGAAARGDLLGRLSNAAPLHACVQPAQAMALRRAPGASSIWRPGASSCLQLPTAAAGSQPGAARPRAAAHTHRGYRTHSATGCTAPSHHRHCMPRHTTLQDYPYPYDVWLADERPDQETQDWCAENGVRISCRFGVPEYHRPVWPRRTR